MNKKLDWYIRELRCKNDANIDVYNGWLARYFANPFVDLRAQWEIINQKYWRMYDSDLDNPAKVNVIKSVIDSIISSLYNNKVDPSFIPVNGLFKTEKVCDDAQQYFELLYENKNINKIANDVARMACIFGSGHILINPITYEISAIAPHITTFINAEKRYGDNKRVLLKYRNFPISQLSKYNISGRKLPELDSKLTVCFEHYIDVEVHKQLLFVNGTLVKEESYDRDVLPLLTYYYNEPVFGEFTVGLVQELDDIQTQIDIINENISEAIQTTPANMVFVPEGTNLTPNDLDNRGGTAYLISGKNTPNGPKDGRVEVVAPRPYDPSWQQTLQMYVDLAYEMAGKSQLASMGKKPSGLDSGASLKTFTDIESDRFETQTTHYINLFEDLAKLLIEILPEDQDILPQSINNSSYKWKDVKEQSKLFKIRYVPISTMSKDPGENQKIVMQMSQSSQIPLYKFARMFHNPDIEALFNDASAKYDGIKQCIARAIEDEDYDIPIWVEKATLAQEITVTQNKLYKCITGDKENDKYVEDSLKRLLQLEANLKEDMQRNGYVEPDVAEEMVGSDEAGEMGGTGVTNQIADVTSEVQQPQEGLEGDIDSSIEPVGVEEELGNS